MELASGIGLPPPWGAIEDYHFFFKNSTCRRFVNRPYTNQIQPEPGGNVGFFTLAVLGFIEFVSLIFGDFFPTPSPDKACDMSL